MLAMYQSFNSRDPSVDFVCSVESAGLDIFFIQDGIVRILEGNIWNHWIKYALLGIVAAQCSRINSAPEMRVLELYVEDLKRLDGLPFSLAMQNAGMTETKVLIKKARSAGVDVFSEFSNFCTRTKLFHHLDPILFDVKVVGSLRYLSARPFEY